MQCVSSCHGRKSNTQRTLVPIGATKRRAPLCCPRKTIGARYNIRYSEEFRFERADGKLLKDWRRGSESNRRIKVLQTSPLPLGYRARSPHSRASGRVCLEPRSRTVVHTGIGER